MKKLQSQLNELVPRLKNEAEVKARLETLVSVYPFNEFEYLISTLLGAGMLSLDGQHRGNVGEGQLHLKHDNVAQFSKFETRSNELAAAIRNAYQRQTKD